MIPISFPYIPGSDVSGIVEAVGNKVSRIKAADKVYATTNGELMPNIFHLMKNRWQ